MYWLQIRLFGSFFSSFLPHSYGYEPANELKAVLKPPNFCFSPYSPTASLGSILSEYLNSPRLQISFTGNCFWVFSLAAIGNFRYKGNALREMKGNS